MMRLIAMNNSSLATANIEGPMTSTNPTDSNRTTRREFLKTSSTALAGAALASAIAARPGYAAENNTIKIALVGCGGRGSGAVAQALSTQGPTKLWAAADVFDHRLQSSLANLKQSHEKQMDVPPERQFIGLDGFKKAIDSLDKGDLVLLTTPPAFRPIHFEYAVQKGVNVFMEKSFAVDAPGIRRVLRAGEEATKKNLKVAGGLMSRHYKPLEEAIQQIHEGLIGEVVTSWAYRMHGPVGVNPRQPGMKELAYQISNYSNFTWLNGSFIEDWLIHNIDVCCWAKNAWPVSVQGMGGRQVRQDADQLFDHYARGIHLRRRHPFCGAGPAHCQLLRLLRRHHPGRQRQRDSRRRPKQAAHLQRLPPDLGEPHLELQRARLRSLPGRTRPAL